MNKDFFKRPRRMWIWELFSAFRAGKVRVMHVKENGFLCFYRNGYYESKNVPMHELEGHEEMHAHLVGQVTPKWRKEFGKHETVAFEFCLDMELHGSHGCLPALFGKRYEGLPKRATIIHTDRRDAETLRRSGVENLVTKISTEEEMLRTLEEDEGIVAHMVDGGVYKVKGDLARIIPVLLVGARVHDKAEIYVEFLWAMVRDDGALGFIGSSDYTSVFTQRPGKAYISLDDVKGAFYCDSTSPAAESLNALNDCVRTARKTDLEEWENDTANLISGTEIIGLDYSRARKSVFFVDEIVCGLAVNEVFAVGFNAGSTPSEAEFRLQGASLAFIDGKYYAHDFIRQAFSTGNTINPVQERTLRRIVDERLTSRDIPLMNRLLYKTHVPPTIEDMANMGVKPPEPEAQVAPSETMQTMVDRCSLYIDSYSIKKTRIAKFPRPCQAIIDDTDQALARAKRAWDSLSDTYGKDPDFTRATKALRLPF